jgi:hypothetical protein
METGVEGVAAEDGNKVMRMMVPELPIGWSDHGSNGPMTLIGMREWQDVTVSAHFKLPAKNPAGKGTPRTASLQVVDV